MFGRYNFVHGDPARTDAGIEFVKSTVQPLVATQPGSYGVGMWVNRDTGEALVLTVWEDQAALEASEAKVTDVRSEASAVVSGQTTVERYEPVLIDRAGPDEAGDIMRLLKMTGIPADIEKNTAWAHDEIVPLLRQQPGYRGYVVAVDRSTGRAVAMTTYRGRDNAKKALAATEGVRRAAADRGLEITGMQEYEVAVVGIRGPDDAIPTQRTVELPRETTV